jgi:hypothetical protein
MFCLLGPDGEGASITATREQQPELIASRPDVFSPAYVGRHGWVAVVVSKADAGEAAELLEDAWRRAAPKKLVKAFDASD